MREQKRFTWRELKAIQLGLLSFCKTMKGKTLKWFKHNQNCVKVIESGSMTTNLTEISLSIFQMCLSNGITIEAPWVPRSKNLRADYLSKIIDYEDWRGVTCAFFLLINNLWSLFNDDRFASFKNNKLDRILESWYRGYRLLHGRG